MAEQLYREWFVRFRFPGHENTKFEKGVPADWMIAPLDKAIGFTGGATPAKNSQRLWKDGDINWYTPSDITGAAGIFLHSSKDQCNEEGLASCSAKLFPAYSVMMTSRATIGAIGINTTPACTNQGFITCIPNAQYPLSYLYHWLKLAKPHFEALCGGATFPELTKGTFKRIGILTPPMRLVSEFDRQSNPIFKSIESLQKANATLASTRDLLLPHLISGKLRVDHLDIQFPPSMQGDAA
jgi:type I restriction enzyme S subunit